MPDEKVKVTLVHGTWADTDADWMNDESPMWQSLKAAGFEPARFGWTGGNSHGARRVAALELAEELKAHDGPQAVVAHSHGGNISAHAVWRHLSPEQRVGFKVVTLATPFLFARKRSVPAMAIRAALMVAAVIVLSAPLMIWAITSDGLGRASGWVLLGLLLFSPAALLQVFSFLSWRRTSQGRVTADQSQTDFVSSVQVPPCEGGGLLVVRAPDDEAGLGLGAVQLANLGTKLFLPRARPAQWPTVAGWIFLVAAGANYAISQEVGDTLTFVASSAIAAVVFLVFAIISLSTVLSTVQGWDGPTAWFLAEVTAESTPPGRHAVVQQPFMPPPRDKAERVSHSSLYEDSAVIDVVLDHLRS